MTSATIYKIKPNKYLVHGNSKTKSGLTIASRPFFKISETELNIDNLANSIKAALMNNGEKVVEDPKNWNEFKRKYLENIGLKSSKELNAPSTKCVAIGLENEEIVFTPTRHADRPEEGFLHKSKNDEISVVRAASNEEITRALDLAFSNCE